MNANPGNTKQNSTPDLRSFASLRGSSLLLKEEVFAVVGAAMEVLNELGHGLHEKPYENALVVEFGLRSNWGRTA